MVAAVWTDQSNIGRFIGGWMLIVVTTVNCLSSVVLLYLIRYMIKRGLLKMNLYIWLVALLTSACLIWDATFYMELYIITGTQGAIYRGLCGYFGTSSALWSFFIIWMVYWTFISSNKERHAANMNNGLYLKLLTLVNVVLSGVASAYMVVSDHGTAWAAYDLARLSIAGMTFLVLLMLLHMLYRTTKKENRHLSPLYHLLRKLALYPLGSVLSRLATIPYDSYGRSLVDFPANAGFVETLVFMLFIILTPALGTFDLLVFVKMQNGVEPLIEMLTCVSAKDIALKMEKEKEIRQSKSNSKSNRSSSSSVRQNKSNRSSLSSVRSKTSAGHVRKGSINSSTTGSRPGSLHSNSMSIDKTLAERTDSISSHVSSEYLYADGDIDSSVIPGDTDEEYSRMSCLDEEELLGELMADDDDEPDIELAVIHEEGDEDASMGSLQLPAQANPMHEHT